MEEEEDDFYGTNADTHGQTESAVAKGEDGGSERMDEDSGADEKAEDDSDDDSITFQLDNEKVVEQVEQEAVRRQAGKLPIDQRQAQSFAPPEPRSTSQAANSQDQKPTPSKSTTRPLLASEAQPTTAAQQADSNAKPASSYPPIRSSTIDFSEAAMNPPFPPSNDKPLRDLDLDADIQDKLWRVPGADQSEWFNYGFDEFTWATYVLKQKELRGFADTTNQQMKDQFGMMGLPVPGGIAGAPPAVQANGQGGTQQSQQPGGVGIPPGMPDEQQMHQMMQQMMASGMDPTQMNLDDFMRFSGMSMPSGGMPGMPTNGQQGQQAPPQQQWGTGGQNFSGGQASRGNRGGRRW